jgi:hypothetical protein
LRDGMGDDKGRYAQGWLPPHPLVISNVLRPVTIAPILLCASRRSSALCSETWNTISVPGNPYSVSPPEYHAKSRSPPSPSGDPGPSFGPAIKPSSDIESPVAAFPMFSPLPPFPIIWAQHTARVLEPNQRIQIATRTREPPSTPLPGARANKRQEPSLSEGLVEEIMAPLSMAGTPPPGCTTAPTRYPTRRSTRVPRRSDPLGSLQGSWQR